LGLLTLVIALNTMVKKRGWPVPPAILTMGVSVAVGALSTLLPEPAVRGFRRLDEVAAMQFLTVWLAPIIFAEGYAMRTKQFFDNIVRIVAHAFVGTTVSAVVVAFCVRYVPAMLGSADQFSLGECLAFGALISATDPVTTLAIFKEQRMAENGLGHLYYTVLGESVLNDAVGIVLFTMFSKLVTDDKEIIGVGDVAEIATEFTMTFVGSMIIGLSLGCLMPLVLKYTPLAHKSSKPSLGSPDEAGTKGILDDDSDDEDELEFNIPEIGVALVLGMIPYLLAEACDLSGIVAIMFAGMVARYYAHHNLTRETRQIFLPTVELVAQLCETYVFIILGLGTFLFEGEYSLPLILAAVLGCLLGRAAHVYPLSAAVNCCSKSERLLQNEQHMVCFAGLRGAIAFICAFSFPETSHLQHRYDVIRTTTVIVGFSLLGMGWPTSAMMRWLDIKPQEAPPQCFIVPPSAGSGPRTPRFSHRRARSDTPFLQDTEGEQCQSPKGGGGGVVGCFRRLDFSLRRFLMTKDAIYEVNHARFRRLSRAPFSRSTTPAAGSPLGPSSHRPAKSWGGQLDDDVEGRDRASSAWTRDSEDGDVEENEDVGARRCQEPQMLKEPLLPAMRPAELPAHGRAASD
jgi:NhaP-type Na+/H+ or K+/H+ antiporter